ncbi:MAG: DUF1643 domain-containing protein [Candidatus Obscuribacterales bacterium]|nr:DUF1643 domain-containing protein [Candidatus Obscuribacterales bacterium]
MKESFGAVFDDTGKYRYRLWRRWQPGLPSLCFVMLNPSTADATINDPTIARCVSMAERWGFGAIEVVNLFAYRSTKPRDLWQAEDPVGEHNDEHIKRALLHSQACVLAWGNLPASRLERSKKVLKILGKKKTYCLGLTKLNQPRHPLYLSADVQLEDFQFDAPVGKTQAAVR